MTTDPKKTEFVVRVPVIDRHKKHCLMKFNGSIGMNVENWTLDGTAVTMTREDNRKTYESDDLYQSYGAGTEYGKAQRAEARRKKLGRASKDYKLDNQPWILNVEGKEARKYRGIREGGAGEFSDYWAFLKAGEGVFEAVKVDDWYKFLPVARHKILDADTAEEQFLKRGRVLNQFALKAELKKLTKGEPEDDEANISKTDNKRTSKSFKISDRDDYQSDSDSGNERQEGEAEDTKAAEKSSKKAGKGSKKGRRKKKREEEDQEEIRGLDSDDGDEEGREVDYISDSGSEPEATKEDDVVENALVGVGDETGLRGIILSDDEEDDEDDEKDNEEPTAAPSSADTTDTKEGDEKESDSGSDSDDPDKEDLKSALFLHSKSGEKRSAGDMAEQEPSAKRVRTDSHSHHHEKGITEDAVRRYLERKPHTTKELLAKFKPRCQEMSKEDIVKTLAAILKRLNPDKERKTKGNKEMLFFSLKS